MIAARLTSATRATCGAAALIAMLLAGGCSKSGAPAGGPPGAAPVSVAAAVQRTVGDSYEFTGRLEAPRWVELRPRIGGTIERVHFRDGARVAAGAPLFTIDPKPYEAELARAQSQLAAARSRAELATQDLKRATQLLEAKAVSRQEFDQLTSGAATSSADKASQRRRAPIAGDKQHPVVTGGGKTCLHARQRAEIVVVVIADDRGQRLIAGLTAVGVDQHLIHLGAQARQNMVD